jgi:hypothetical protein
MLLPVRPTEIREYMSDKNGPYGGFDIYRSKPVDEAAPNRLRMITVRLVFNHDRVSVWTPDT